MSNQEMFKRVVLTIEPWGDEFIVRMQTVHADGKVGMMSQTGILKYSEAGPAAMNWAKELYRTFMVPVEIRKTVLMRIVETDHVTKVEDEAPAVGFVDSLVADMRRRLNEEGHVVDLGKES